MPGRSVPLSRQHIGQVPERERDHEDRPAASRCCLHVDRLQAPRTGTHTSRYIRFVYRQKRHTRTDRCKYNIQLIPTLLVNLHAIFNICNSVNNA